MSLLKLHIKQHIEVDPTNGQPIYYSGNSPASLVKQNGTLPAHRQWRNFNSYIDVTGDVSNLHNLTLTFTTDRDSSGQPIPGGEFAKKSASGTLLIEGEAYSIIKDWLIDDESAALNIVDVQIEHVGCGVYDDFTIKATDIDYCSDEICEFSITLKQKEDPYTCIQNTLIADNWQGWFPPNGHTTGKRHPRFSYCNEVRPNGMMITLWWVIMQLSSLIFLFVIAFVPIINTIIVIVKAIIAVINAIISFINALGANINPINDNLSIITAQDVKDIIGNFFIESSGCGREHPAPLIRDYISNVCSKCGVRVDENTAPIFFADTITIETSTDRQNKTGAQPRGNPYKNACYLNAVKARGIRRFEKINILQGAVPNLTDYWLPDNEPFMTLEMFLDSLKPLFNIDWKVNNNTLYIDRKDFWQQESYVFDYEGADRSLIIDGICYTWNGDNYPAIVKGLYSSDGADVCGNEAQSHYDGIVGVGVTAQNPLFKGMLDKSTQFGAAKFRLDGASNDYVLDAFQQITNTQFISVAPWAPQIIQDVLDNYYIPYADYALLLKQETATLPKILIWDGGSFDNAKCFRPHSAYPINGATTPTINFRYNNNPFPFPWEFKHFPKTFVSGSNLSVASYPAGYYSVKTLFGATVVTRPAFLVNYPMYFEPGYRDTLWDWFHWIDDPLINPKLNKTFELKMELCCDTLKRIKPFQDARNIVLGQKIRIPNNGRYVDAKITEISISYKTDDINGMYIELRGVL